MRILKVMIFCFTIFIFVCRNTPLLRNAIFPDSLWRPAIAYSAMAAVAMISRSDRESIAAIMAFASGVIVGAALSDPCSPIGIVVGPITGCLVFRRIRAGKSRSSPIAIDSINRQSRSSEESDHADIPIQAFYQAADHAGFDDEIA